MPLQTVTVSINVGQVLGWIIVGLVAGALANALIRGRRYNSITSLLTGLIGAIVGGLLFSFLNIQVPAELLDGINIRWIDFIVAFIGALVVLLLIGLVYGFRRRL
jgi:uncharacterized membrane protein YeaQ/YmgE (transglycosylase-associated protein family)